MSKKKKETNQKSTNINQNTDNQADNTIVNNDLPEQADKNVTVDAEELSEAAKQSEAVNTSKAEASSDAEKEFHGEDNLEIRKMKLKDRISAKKERIRKNMESMSKKEKIKYLVYYYKWHALAIIAIIFCAIYFPVTIYLNHRPVAISYAILNNSNVARLDVFDDYMDYYGLDNSYQIIKNPYVELDLATYDELYAANPESSNFTQFPMLCYSGYYDVIITNSAGMKYCSTTGITYKLDSSLSPDMYQLFCNDYPSLLVKSEDYSGNQYDYGIDISNTSFAKSLNLSYTDVYLCFFGLTEQNINNSDKLLNYIFNLNYDISTK